MCAVIFVALTVGAHDDPLASVLEVAIFAFVIGMTIALLDGWLRTWRAWRRLAALGVPTTGYVTATGTEPRGPDSNSWTLSFEYDVGGDIYKGKFKEGTWHSSPPRLLVGDAFPVIYDPDRPAVSAWDNGGATLNLNGNATFGTFVIGVLLAGFMLLIAAAVVGPIGPR
jgi:hypothetical protein